MDDSAMQPTAVGEDGKPYDFPNGVVSMLTTAQGAHMTMSSMSDSKASTLMAATFVVFSLTIDRISNNQLTLPMLILGVFSLASTIWCVMAIKPSLITPGKGLAPGANLMFFGAFSGLKEKEFIDRVITVMQSEELTYRTMARDLFQNGYVLQHKKYPYLAYAYTTFLVGLALTVSSMVWEQFFGKVAFGN